MEDEKRRAAQEAAHVRVGLAIQSDSLGIFEWDVGSDYMRLDARCCDLYGLVPTETLTPVNRSVLWTRVPAEDHAQIQEVLESAARARSLFKHRYRVAPSDVLTRHVEITGLFTEKFGPSRMVGVIRDVSLEVAASNTASKARADELAAHTRSRLLSRLSHELRTPLNAIRGFSQLLMLEARELLPGHRVWLQELDRAAIAQLQMVDDVLRVSLVAGGGLPFAREQVDLYQSVCVAVSQLSADQEQAGVSIAIQPLVGVLQGDCRLLADRERLQEALQKLMRHLLTSARAGKAISISVDATCDDLRIRVSAPGWVGPMHTTGSELIRSPTAQLGFSLALVEVLVQRMGGTLSITSGPSGGMVELSWPRGPRH